MSTQPACTGGCLCKQIQYSIYGKFAPNILCYCSNCQIAGGSAFAWAQFFEDGRIEFNSGEDLVRRYEDKETRSGKTLTRAFCTNCGSQVYAQTGPWVIAYVGSMHGEKPKPQYMNLHHDKPEWAPEYSDFFEGKPLAELLEAKTAKEEAA